MGALPSVENATYLEGRSGQSGALPSVRGALPSATEFTKLSATATRLAGWGRYRALPSATEFVEWGRYRALPSSWNGGATERRERNLFGGSFWTVRSATERTGGTTERYKLGDS